MQMTGCSVSSHIITATGDVKTKDPVHSMGLLLSPRNGEGQPTGESTVLLTHLAPKKRQQWAASAVLSTRSPTTTCAVEAFIGPPPYPGP